MFGMFACALFQWLWLIGGQSGPRGSRVDSSRVSRYAVVQYIPFLLKYGAGKTWHLHILSRTLAPDVLHGLATPTTAILVVLFEPKARPIGLYVFYMYLYPLRHCVVVAVQDSVGWSSSRSSSSSNHNPLSIVASASGFTTLTVPGVTTTFLGIAEPHPPGLTLHQRPFFIAAPGPSVV